MSLRMISYMMVSCGIGARYSLHCKSHPLLKILDPPHEYLRENVTCLYLYSQSNKFSVIIKDLGRQPVQLILIQPSGEKICGTYQANPNKNIECTTKIVSLFFDPIDSIIQSQIHCCKTQHKKSCEKKVAFDILVE